ncbi:unnamed protein product, partial [Sphacelaria rigidula]
MEIISPKFLLIETNAGADDITQSAVIVRNTGSTALYFTWSRVHKGETIVSANRFIGGPILSPPSDKNNDDYINASAKGSPPVAEKRVMTTGDGNVASASPGYAFLEASDHRFFCHQ